MAQQALDLEPLDLEPVTPPPVTLDLEPLDLEPIEPTKEGYTNTGILGKLTEPWWEGPSRLGASIANSLDAPSLERSPLRAQFEGFTAGATEGLGDLASGLTSPLDMALMLLTGGSGIAAKKGATTAVKGLNTAIRAGSGLVGAEGAHRVATNNPITSESEWDSGQIGQGLLEIVGGLAGGFGKLPSVAEAILSPPPVRAQRLLAESNPREFIGGPSGSPGRGQVAPADVSPDMAARVGGLVSDTPAGPSGSVFDSTQLAEQRRLQELGFGEFEQQGISHLDIPEGTPARYTPYQQGDTSLGFSPDGSRISTIYDTVPDRLKPRAVQGGMGEAVPSHLKEPVVETPRQGVVQGDIEPTVKLDLEPEFYAGEGRALPGDAPSPSAQKYRRVQETAVPTEVVDAMTPQNKLLQVLEEAKVLNKEQRAIYTRERAVKAAKAAAVDVTDEASMNKFMASLGGAHTKVHFENVRSKLTQADVDGLLGQIGQSDLPVWDKTHAYGGMRKILGEGGVVPQPSEVKILRKIFGEEFADTLLTKLPDIDKNLGFLAELVNFPRGIMTSFDLSAPFRQGIGLVHKKEFWKSFSSMFKSLGSEEGFNAVQESIRASPSYALATSRKTPKSKRSILALTDLHSLSTREEAVMSTWAETGGSIKGISPLYKATVGRGVRASNRAYVSFLNKLRMDTFDSLVKNAVKMGDDPNTNRVLANELADFVNTATGRGNLGALEKHAVALNSTMFSPRLMAARLKMLNPHYYATANPMVRKEALKSLMATASFGSSIVGLGKAAGAEVSMDPTSSDFMKLKFGNTRLDPFGGFQQYIVAAMRLGNYGKDLATGDMEGYGPYGKQSGADTIGRFMRYKEHPSLSFVHDMLSGEDAIGRPFDLSDAMIQRLTPIMLQDLYELNQDDPSLIPFVMPPAAFGMGSQTHQER